MRTEKTWLTLATVVVLGLAQVARAEPAPTTITIPDMECKGCANKVAKALAVVPGVGEIQTDVKVRKAVIKPKPQMTLSPRALWEALEQIHKEPSKLEGPSGTFTAKPQS